METTRPHEEVTRLAYFERRNNQTGNTEQIRLQVGEFAGKLLTSARIWYRVKPQGPDDDGWRPSKSGFTIREHEVGLWIGALEKVQVMLAERPGRQPREPRRPRGSPQPSKHWQPAPHTRSEVYRPNPLPGRLPTPGAAKFSEFDDEGGSDG